MSKYILFFASILFFFTSCQKVIDINLNNAEPAIVIEANLYEGTNDFKVVVTKTSNYFSTEAQPVINNATIQLTDPSNQVHVVPFVGNGVYTIPNFTATINSTYKLNVTIDGKSYLASATIPNHTNIDSLSYEEFSGFGGNEKDQYLMLTHLKDSVGIRNYYRVLVTRNDTLQNKPDDYYLFDDIIRDGQYIDAPLFTTFFKLNDTVNVSLLGMDANVYSYLTTLSEVITSDANTSAAPANPNTNFSNGALGFFGAFSRSTMSIRIKAK